ncbi:MAG: DNA-directed RNA polymerase subunit beta' [Parcubacteria group bacterium ADurb.Bin247]|nr:MAG: DNA-directed RNA polymerase subunit beta' [Parcubacteria group bacterium ADurb.Bin247]
MRVEDLDSIRIMLASPDKILEWSHGEITKAETINYRNQRPEKNGLFCEKIFGPEKDYECYCGKYKKIRYKGIVCDRCGVEVTKASVRRERLGHIKLACPVSHIWFLRGIPSRIGMVLDIPMQKLEKVIYFAAYMITDVNYEEKSRVAQEIDVEFNQKLKTFEAQKESKEKIQELKLAKLKSEEELGRLQPLSILSEVEYYDLSIKYGEIFEAGTGAETLRKVFEKINIKELIKDLKKKIAEAPAGERIKIQKRLKMFQSMNMAGIRPEWMFLTVIPVLPADLRPIVQLDGGRYASSDLNDLYRRVINRNNRLKYLLEIGAPDVIVRNEKRMLQESVDALIDNEMRKGVTTQSTTGGRRLLKSLGDMLKGKQGRFRHNLLGKRVDYSGRSVIVVGPQLKLYQCGLPKKMALELFKPFIIGQILKKELAYNVRGATRLIEDEIDEVWAILEDVVKNKVVLLNRAPTLHRLGFQAFEPVLIEDNVIQLHPLVCSAFNADFDGDQMAVHLPLSDEAQKEAREIMLSSENLLKPATGLPSVSPSQDIVLGCYWLTKIIKEGKGEGMFFGSFSDALLAQEFGHIDLRSLVKIQSEDGLIETSVGRIIFNKILPSGFQFQNDLMNSKNIRRVVRDVIKNYGKKIAQETLDKMKDLGFEYSTRSGVSWGMSDLTVPEEKEEIIKKAIDEVEKVESFYKKGLFSKDEKKEKNIEIWHKAKREIEKMVPKTLGEYGSVFTIIDSGSRGSWSQPVQMAGMKGLVANPAGQTIELPVKSSFKEGFDVLEYFISTHGARKGTADTALRTATAGYLTRRLIDVSHEVIVLEDDCKDTEGIVITKKETDEIDQDLAFRIVGRVAMENIGDIVKKGEIIDWRAADNIMADDKIESVRVRSLLTCKTIRGVCKKCYGWDFGSNKEVNLGEAVGIVAAQAIGEPGTQLTMRTFHTGGVAGGGDITLGLPRVQEIFEVRIPGGKAEMAKTDGVVQEIMPDGVIRVKIAKSEDDKKSKRDVIEYKVSPKAEILVEKGQKIKKGDILSSGNLDIKDVFKNDGIKAAQEYIRTEVQKIYVSQGVNVHDKHIEVIIRQMFSRVKVKDEGDSILIPGEVIEKEKLFEINEKLKKEGKKEVVAVPILLGITNVALSTDSFLSAASFQETSRVLIKSALEGREDKLRGLKENVIIGKIIPAGTGFNKKK